MNPVSVRGQKGAKRDPGVQGPPGQKGELGPMPFKNWKECAWKNVNDGKDNGLIKASVFSKCINYLKKGLKYATQQRRNIKTQDKQFWSILFCSV